MAQAHITWPPLVLLRVLPPKLPWEDKASDLLCATCKDHLGAIISLVAWVQEVHSWAGKLLLAIVRIVSQEVGYFADQPTNAVCP